MQGKIRDKSSIGASLCLVLAVCTMAQALTVFRVATTKKDEAFPTVSGNRVVWQFYNSRYGDWDIYAAIVDGPEVATEVKPLQGQEDRGDSGGTCEMRLSRVPVFWAGRETLPSSQDSPMIVVDEATVDERAPETALLRPQ